MNVSRKILVIIYIIFALLISVVILASQSILYSSFSDLQEKEATENVEKVEDIIDFQVLHLEEINSALSSRNDVRALMLNQHPQLRVHKDYKFSERVKNYLFFMFLGFKLIRTSSQAVKRLVYSFGQP